MRIIRAEQGPSAPKLTAKERAVLAAVEAQLAKYIQLKCGHSTTVETQLAYARWKPKGRRFFCETCEEWLTQAPKPKAPLMPDTPLFLGGKHDPRWQLANNEPDEPPRELQLNAYAQADTKDNSPGKPHKHVTRGNDT